VCQNILLKFFIDPIHSLLRVKADIADTLILYANVYGGSGNWPKEKLDEASNKARVLAAQLLSRAALIPWYGLFSFLRLVPRYSSLANASSRLIFLHNNLYSGGDADQVYKAEQTIKSSLGLK
jgi:hypothetical protein